MNMKTNKDNFRVALNDLLKSAQLIPPLHPPLIASPNNQNWICIFIVLLNPKSSYDTRVVEIYVVK